MNRTEINQMFEKFNPIGAFDENDWNKALEDWKPYYNEIISEDGLPIEKWLKNKDGYLPDFLDTKEKKFGHARIGNYDHIKIYQYTGADEKRLNKYINGYASGDNRCVDKIEDISNDYQKHIQKLLKKIASAKTIEEIYEIEKEEDYQNFSCKQILRKITILCSLLDKSPYKYEFSWFFDEKRQEKLADIFDVKTNKEETFFQINNKIYKKAKEYMGINENSPKKDIIKLYYFLGYLSAQIRIWKISHGPNDISKENRDLFKQRQIITMDSETGATGGSKKTQGEIFKKEIKQGDFFYLCYGNKIQLLGKIVSNKFKSNEQMGSTWIEYAYEVVFNCIKNEPYTGSQKHWTPNFRTTLKLIPNNELDLFENLILQPFFGKKIIDLFAITEEKDTEENEVQNRENNYKISHTKKLLASKNIIFRGAPGTGKSFLAKQIAADIISGGAHTDYQRLTPEEKKQVEFVQFHPSYDYSDFVEGLRPVKNGSGIDFDLRSGIFKAFCEKAKKSVVSFDDAWSLLLENAKQNNDLIDIERERSSQQLKWNEKNQKFYGTTGSLIYQWADYESCKKTYEDIFESNPNSGSNQQTKNNSLGIVNLLKEKYNLGKKDNFVFIIDEINRGEISKIFGELFYSIEPSKRGKAGEIATQYANMHPKDEELFYIPENVYIIGTMNDIDRSVDSFDFAMRRRFKFIEITAEESQAMLDTGIEDAVLRQEAKNRMNNLNEAIKEEAKLNSNYFIGASYFMDIKEVDDFEELWNDNLQPLLQEYIVGSYGADKTIEKLKLAYDDKADNKQKDNNADDGAKDDESNKNNG